MATPDEILAFWLDELEPKAWYVADDAVDEAIRSRFGEMLDRAKQGALSPWLTYPPGTLAYNLPTHQFPRNMFRCDARSFATDHIARAAAKMAIDRGWDMKIDEPARQFFYMPLMHSENITDQDRCVRLVKSRMDGGNTLLHARAHREVIRRFGRFPYRNEALGRQTTPSEAAFLQGGSDGTVVRELEAEGA